MPERQPPGQTEALGEQGLAVLGGFGTLLFALTGCTVLEPKPEPRLAPGEMAIVPYVSAGGGSVDLSLGL